jgi:hypothetical protein
MTLDRFSLCSAGYLVSTHDGAWVRHVDAQARITQLESERDAWHQTASAFASLQVELDAVKAELTTARAEGYAAGLRDAAQACDRIAGNTADFGRDHRRAAGQCAAMIRARLTRPITPPAGPREFDLDPSAHGCGLDTQKGK